MPIDWVIDADTHITEPPDVWTARLPKKFQARAPHIVEDSRMPGWDVWKIGEGTAPITVGHTAVAGWPDRLVEWLKGRGMLGAKS